MISSKAFSMVMPGTCESLAIFMFFSKMTTRICTNIFSEFRKWSVWFYRKKLFKRV